MARPGFVYTVHKETGLAHEFPEAALESWIARGWEPAEEPPEDDEVLPESPAPKKKTSKPAAAAEKE